MWSCHNWDGLCSSYKSNGRGSYEPLSISTRGTKLTSLKNSTDWIGSCQVKTSKVALQIKYRLRYINKILDWLNSKDIKFIGFMKVCWNVLYFILIIHNFLKLSMWYGKPEVINSVSNINEKKLTKKVQMSWKRVIKRTII